MEKLERLIVQVGFVFTQAMFCDGFGKLHFHRVMTDPDNPWISVKELLIMIKQALCADKPIGYHCTIDSVAIDVQYRKINFTSILETLRKELEHFLSEGCRVSIKTVKEFPGVQEEPEKQEDVGWKEFLPFGPAEVMAGEDLFSLDVLWMKQEWLVPVMYSELVYTDFGLPVAGRADVGEAGCIPAGEELLAEGLVPVIGGIPLDVAKIGMSFWKGEHDLRGSPGAGEWAG